MGKICKLGVSQQTKINLFKSVMITIKFSIYPYR